MKENRKYIFFGLAIISLIVLFAVLFGNSNEPVDWDENYLEKNKDAFGSFLALKLLDSYFPDHDVHILKDSIGDYLDGEKDPANYVFIGSYSYMDTTSQNSLLEFVERGNRAFIASNTPPLDLMEAAFEDYCGDFYWDYYPHVYDSTANFDLVHSNLALGDSTLYIVYEGENGATNYSWHYLIDDLFCYDNEHIVSLGLLNDSLTNFMKVDYGEGSFYFHTSPVLYTNSALKIEEGLLYANRSFAHLQEGEIYWDKRSRLWSFGDAGDWWNSKKTFDSDGPLKYILAQPSLAWAWYITLVLGILYVLFRAKRQQRIIPVIEPNRNTSLEFISTIGRMYFIQNNHRKLALEKMKLFQAYVREHYKIPTKTLDDKFVKQLASKSEVPAEVLDKIVQMNGNIQSSGFLSEEVLIKFHQVLDKFYKNCK